MQCDYCGCIYCSDGNCMYETSAVKQPYARACDDSRIKEEEE